MSRGAAIGGGLLVTLATPATWPLGLATFLIRGGIVLLVVPIVVLPTPVGIGNALGPTLTSIALGSASTEVFVAGGVAAGAILLWLFAGGLLAATLEAEGARIVAAHEDVARPAGGSERLVRPSGASTGARAAGRILAARLIANIPLGLALAWGSIRLVAVAYDELTSPLDVSTPIVLRVLRATPEVIAAIVLTWMAGEMIGGIAARRIALAGDGVGRALSGAVRTCLRHPLSALGRFWIPTAVLAVILVPSAVASASAWSAVGAVLDESSDPSRAFVAVAGLVLLWVVGLLLASVACAWRAAVWTVAEVEREGTFGGSADRRPGDWRPGESSATL